MKLLYKLVSMLTGKLAARLGRTAFKGLWSRIDAAEPPAATTGEANLPKVVGAAALEAATMAGVAAAVNRFTASAFHHLFGVWPDKPAREQDRSVREAKPDKPSRGQPGKR